MRWQRTGPLKLVSTNVTGELAVQPCWNRVKADIALKIRVL
jgi:hypothetical protein